ncbi:elongation factor P maturation arginine rhamnosyltransferase EarP [Parachitinimonas caeni]|uniref:Protein-arginine rhamnosyltransferase n=1 Tax=Parachitinimonas caeni TaxID=3031301 RepID=A0ABT7DRB7_9NEIS|nr:elongation factor P maturation arginine rhamnosyltransferase EarP [Parachitinimonas caeni]MDK2122614.1 elongation factor P maturation arginine rhamnosyltransferase EarP [Parachitinimonas caeni]
MTNSLHFTIFCKVVDNFGDIGICWRLARQLHSEHNASVSLWVDDLTSFQAIAPAIDCQQARQLLAGVEVVHWPDELVEFESDSNVIIESFACELPKAVVGWMVRQTKKPVWINLEYLTAESWIDGCHALASLQPAQALQKFFFFPGFSSASGGLLRERDLPGRRRSFQTGNQAPAFLQQWGIARQMDELLISLFCYDYAKVEDLLNCLREGENAVRCIVPAGKMVPAVCRFLELDQPDMRAIYRRGALSIQFIPFLNVQAYDELLWSCDLNFVRGEDSWIRAQWAAVPLIWQPYRQDDGAHLEKLDAFMQRYCAQLPDEVAQCWQAISRAWSGDEPLQEVWRDFIRVIKPLRIHAAHWADQLAQQPDLASNLVNFCQSRL